MQWPQSQFNEIKCSREEQSPIWYKLFWRKRCVRTSSYLCSDCVEEGTCPVFLLWTLVSSQFLTPFYWQLRVWVHLCVCYPAVCRSREHCVLILHWASWMEHCETDISPWQHLFFSVPCPLLVLNLRSQGQHVQEIGNKWFTCLWLLKLRHRPNRRWGTVLIFIYIYFYVYIFFFSLPLQYQWEFPHCKRCSPLPPQGK